MLPFLRVRCLPEEESGMLFIVRSVSAGGYSRSQEAAGETPWGFPNQFENE